MGFLDKISHLFSNHDSSSHVRLGKPLTVHQARKALSRVVLQAPLLSLRATAEALHQMQQETPAFITYSMDHYFNAPRLVRFQNSGGKIVDVTAAESLHGQPGVLADEVEIQHMMGDIEDREGHMSADDLGSTDITPLVERTTQALRDPSSTAAHDWLFALHDQLDDIVTATGGNLGPLADALKIASPNAAAAEDDAADTGAARVIRVTIANAVAADQPELHTALADPAATTTAYMAAVEILRRHGIDVPDTIDLTD